MTDSTPDTAATVPTALDFPKCRACQMWKDAGASWPRPCKQHYGGEPEYEAQCPCCLRGTLDHDGDCAWCRDHCMICVGTVRHGIR